MYISSEDQLPMTDGRMHVPCHLGNNVLLQQTSLQAVCHRCARIMARLPQIGIVCTTYMMCPTKTLTCSRPYMMLCAQFAQQDLCNTFY